MYNTAIKMNLTRKITGGHPIRAIAVESLRLFPPLYVPADLLEYLTSPSFWIPHSATFEERNQSDQTVYGIHRSAQTPVIKASMSDGILVWISNVFMLCGFQGQDKTAGIAVRP